MKNFKFPNLLFFFFKKPIGYDYTKKDYDYPNNNSSEKKLFNDAENDSTTENILNLNNNNINANAQNYITNGKSYCEITYSQQALSKERSEKTTITKGYLTNNPLTLGFLPALYLISSISILFILLSIKAFSNSEYKTFLSQADTQLDNKPLSSNVYPIQPNIKTNAYKAYNNNINNNNNYKHAKQNFNVQLITNINNNNKINKNKFSKINHQIKQHNINLTSSLSIKIPNFYDLQKINTTAFNGYIILSCVSSLAISLILFTVLKQRFKVPEFRAHSFKLNIMLLFSLASNCLDIARAFAPLIFNSFFRFGEELQPELENETKQFLFLLHIFFSILFALYLTSILSLVRNKNIEKNENSFFSQMQTEVHENKWFLYKYITLFYLCALTLIYVLVLLQDANFISFGFFDVYVKAYSQYIMGLFPYFIQVLNAILVFTFYFELNFVNMALAQNLDVDYLFEEDDKIGL